jgi:hypothetical protein
LIMKRRGRKAPTKKSGSHTSEGSIRFRPSQK